MHPKLCTHTDDNLSISCRFSTWNFDACNNACALSTSISGILKVSWASTARQPLGRVPETFFLAARRFAVMAGSLRFIIQVAADLSVLLVVGLSSIDSGILCKCSWLRADCVTRGATGVWTTTLLSNLKFLNCSRRDRRSLCTERSIIGEIVRGEQAELDIVESMERLGGEITKDV